MADAVYALNLFNVVDCDEYLAYSRRSAKEVQTHGGKVVALGKFREAAAGEIKPRTVLILVEWESKEAFDGYCSDPRLAVKPRSSKIVCFNFCARKSAGGMRKVSEEKSSVIISVTSR